MTYNSLGVNVLYRMVEISFYETFLRSFFVGIELESRAVNQFLYSPGLDFYYQCGPLA